MQISKKNLTEIQKTVVETTTQTIVSKTLVSNSVYAVVCGLSAGLGAIGFTNASKNVGELTHFALLTFSHGIFTIYLNLENLVVKALFIVCFEIDHTVVSKTIAIISGGITITYVGGVVVTKATLEGASSMLGAAQRTTVKAVNGVVNGAKKLFGGIFG